MILTEIQTKQKRSFENILKEVIKSGHTLTAWDMSVKQFPLLTNSEIRIYLNNLK